MSLREQARVAVERHRAKNTQPGPKKPRHEVIVPAHVRVQTLPGHPGYDTRIHAEPGSYGAGFAAVGIGRDVDTGEVWK